MSLGTLLAILLPATVYGKAPRLRMRHPSKCLQEMKKEIMIKLNENGSH